MMAKKPKIVAATMAAGGAGGVGRALSSKAIEDAMSAATLKAMESGITDPEKILKLKLAARQKVKAEHRAAEAAAAKAAAAD